MKKLILNVRCSYLIFKKTEKTGENIENITSVREGTLTLSKRNTLYNFSFRMLHEDDQILKKFEDEETRS